MSQPHGTADERTPRHYRGREKLQPWDIIDAFNLDFYCGNVVKYVCRFGIMADPADLDKALHYLEAELQRRLGRAPLYSDAIPVTLPKGAGS